MGEEIFFFFNFKKKESEDRSQFEDTLVLVCLFWAVSIKIKQTQMKQGSSHLKSFTHHRSCQGYAQNKLIGFNFMSNVFSSLLIYVLICDIIQRQTQEDRRKTKVLSHSQFGIVPLKL